MSELSNIKTEQTNIPKTRDFMSELEDVQKAPTTEPTIEKEPGLLSKIAAPLKDLWLAGTTPTESKNIFGAIKETGKSFGKMQAPETRETEISRAKEAKEKAIQEIEDKYLEEFKRQMEWANEIGGIGAQTLVRAGHQAITGATGKELPDISTGSKVADTISSLIGQLTGFAIGASLTGGLGAGSKAASLATRGMSKELAASLAGKVVQGAIKEGVNMSLLSGLHSVANADTKEEALNRAMEYGLMGLVFGGGGVLLKPTAKAIKSSIQKQPNAWAEFKLPKKAPKLKAPKKIEPKIEAKLEAPVERMSIAEVEKISKNPSKYSQDDLMRAVKEIANNPQTYGEEAANTAKLNLQQFARKVPTPGKVEPVIGEYEYIHTKPIESYAPEGKTSLTGKKAIKEASLAERTTISGKKNVNILRSNELAMDIEKLAPKEQRAITEYLNAGGGQEYEGAVMKHLDEAFNKATDNQKLRQAITDAKNLSPEAKEAAKKVSKFFAEHKDYAKKISGKDILKDKYVPYSDIEASKLVKQYGRQRAMSIAKYEAIKSDPNFYKKIGYGQEIPEGFKRISDDIAVPKEFADMLKIVFNETLYDSPGKIAKIQQAIKQTSLSFDGYTHLKMELTDLAESGGAPIRAIKRLMGKDVMTMKQIPKELVEDWVSHGLTTGKLETGADILTEKIRIKGLKKIFQAEEKSMDWLFNQRQTYFKVMQADKLKLEYLSKNTDKVTGLLKVTDQQISAEMAKIARNMNNIYKGVNLEVANIPPGFIKQMQTWAVLAPKWTTASVQTIKEVAKGNPYAIRSLVKAIAVMQLTGQAINLYTTGHTTLENEEGHKLDTKLWGDTYFSFSSLGIEDLARAMSKVLDKGVVEGILSFVMGKFTSAPGMSFIQSGRWRWGIRKNDGELAKLTKVLTNMFSDILPDVLEEPGKAAINGKEIYEILEEFMAAVIGGRVSK